ncbi:MAG TPA: diadenylate cyclase [Myxococcota bacterium]|nr:diadenylate cyclase [Myxococcota bacterium]
MRLLNNFGMIDALDIVFVSVALYVGIVALRSARAGPALGGVGVLVAAYLGARQLGMQLTAWLFQGFFAVLVIVLVVIFQSELRRLFERIAVVGLRRGRADEPHPQTADALVRSAIELARNRAGALIVVCGRDPVERYVEGGVLLGGRVSDALLLSLFEKHSPGHDGAVIIEGDRVARFGAQLPLSNDFAQLRRRGTRHSAALGLAERTDAVCLVVSEERGQISIAREGVLRSLEKPEDVAVELPPLLRLREPRSGRRELVWRALRERWVEKLVALGLACFLWIAFVPGAQVDEVSYDLPIAVDNLPAGYTLEKVDPPQLEVTLSGPRRRFILLDEKRLEVRLDGFLVEAGRRSFDVPDEAVVHPAGLKVTSVTPRRVKLSIRRTGEAGTETQG